MCIKCTYFRTQRAHNSGETSYPSDVIFFRLSYNQNRSYGLADERKRIRRGRIAVNLITWKGLRQKCGSSIEDFISHPGSLNY
jgi:hypothetical protein